MSSGLNPFAQHFLRDDVICVCVVIKCVGVVVSLTIYAPSTGGLSPCLCSCVVALSLYVDFD
jgi:hypothetical protein